MPNPWIFSLIRKTDHLRIIQKKYSLILLCVELTRHFYWYLFFDFTFFIEIFKILGYQSSYLSSLNIFVK